MGLKEITSVIKNVLISTNSMLLSRWENTFLYTAEYY
jgi:hypothetical protein